jgi:hypothetical protein
MRRYPESGPERREREEYRDRAYGAGSRELTNCRKCSELFTEADIKAGRKISSHTVDGGQRSGSDTIPIRTYDSGGVCTRCLRRDEETQQKEKEMAGSDEQKKCYKCGAKGPRSDFSYYSHYESDVSGWLCSRCYSNHQATRCSGCGKAMASKGLCLMCRVSGGRK